MSEYFKSDQNFPKPYEYHKELIAETNNLPRAIESGKHEKSNEALQHHQNRNSGGLVNKKALVTEVTANATSFK